MIRKITSIVHSATKQQRVEKRGDILHIYVLAKAREGWANVEATEVLAGYLKIAKSNVVIKLGKKNKQKIFEIYEQE